eukprot:5853455-Amphidinium_carterae.1
MMIFECPVAEILWNRFAIVQGGATHTGRDGECIRTVRNFTCVNWSSRDAGRPLQTYLCFRRPKTILQLLLALCCRYAAAGHTA